MHEIKVEIKDKKYPIIIGSHNLNEFPKKIMEGSNYHKVLIVTDENVSNLYLESLKEAFIKLDVVIKTFIVSGGEQSKSLEMLNNLYDYLAENQFTRKDAIIALGGGVIGDLTGFAAATYLRGIDFIQIPTTLLAQVDSSVGGKVAVNLPQGKNLVGNFYQPKGVYIDVEVLNSLPIRELKSGMGEVIKYACIYDRNLLDTLLSLDINNIKEHIKEIIVTCLLIKLHYVKNDELETHERMHLNYGHTIGHGIEKYFNYDSFNHGEAIAMGMLLMLRAQVKNNLVDKSELEVLETLLSNYGLIKEHSYNKKQIMSFIKVDKKTIAEDINIILLKKLGESYIKKVSIQEFEDFIAEVL